MCQGKRAKPKNHEHVSPEKCHASEIILTVTVVACKFTFITATTYSSANLFSVLVSVKSDQRCLTVDTNETILNIRKKNGIILEL